MLPLDDWRIPWRSIAIKIPIAINTIIIAFPPWLISGSGTPITGAKPVAVMIFIATYRKMMICIPEAANRAKREAALDPTCQDQRSNNQKANSTAAPPKRPHSSNRVAKMRSV